MGDVVSLVEKAAEAITEEDARRMEEKMRTASFDLDDFLHQFKLLTPHGTARKCAWHAAGHG